MKVKVDAKKYSALCQMHYGRIKTKVKVKWLQKQMLDLPLLFVTCHSGKLKLLIPWHCVTSGLCWFLHLQRGSPAISHPHFPSSLLSHCRFCLNGIHISSGYWIPFSHLANNWQCFPPQKDFRQPSKCQMNEILYLEKGPPPSVLLLHSPPPSPSGLLLPGLSLPISRCWERAVQREPPFQRQL